MPLIELTDLELKMAWVITDAGMDAAFANLSHEERVAALNMFEKLYAAYRQPRAA